MKKITSRLSLVILLFLSFVIMLGSVASMNIGARAEDNSEPLNTTVTSDDWYEITVTDDSLTILLDAEIYNYRSVSADDLADIKNALISALHTLVIDKVINFETKPEAGPQPARFALTAYGDNGNGDSVLDNLDDSVLGKYKDFIKDRLSAMDEDGMELDKFLTGEYDALMKYAVSEYLAENPDVKYEDVMTDVESAVQEVVEQLVESGTIDEEYAEWYRDEVKNKVDEVVQEAEEIVQNGGTYTLSLLDYVNMVRKLTIGGTEVFSNGKLQLDGIKALIRTLPRLADIANRTDDQMTLSYDVWLSSTVGDEGFNLTVGFKGDCSDIRSAARYLADRVNVYNDNGTYMVEANVTEEYSAVLLKLANSSRIPDKIKQAVFGMFDKTGNEIFDMAAGYSVQEVLDYVKGVDFASVFNGLLNANYMKSFFADYNVSLLDKLTDANIDKFVNSVLNYAEKLANKEDVSGLEDFLKEYGLPGIPSKLEPAVQQFMDLLNKINFDYWNATTLREYLKDGEKFNAKVDAAISRLSKSAKVQDAYEGFINFAERLFNKMPETFHNSTPIDFYNGEGKVAWSGNVNYDLRSLITKVMNRLVPYAEEAGEESAETYAGRIQNFIDTYIGSGEINVNFNLSLNVNLTDIYQVTYMVNNEQHAAGLLPVGANVELFANLKEVDGYKIVAWIDEEGNEYETMPDHDVVLYAVTQFEAKITQDEVEVEEEISKNFDGKPVELKVEIIGSAGNPTFCWYKDGEVLEGATEQTLQLLNVADSGEYYCVVTGESAYYTPEATTQTVTVTINPFVLQVKGEWNYTQPFTYNGKLQGVEFNLSLADHNLVLPEGVDDFLTLLETGVSENEYTDAGVYTAEATVNLTKEAEANYKLELTKDTLLTQEWEIEKFVLNVKGEWNYTQPFTYNGKLQGVEFNLSLADHNLVLPEGVDDFLTLLETGVSENEYTDAGVYTAEATVSLIEEAETNYKLVLTEDTSLTQEWAINKLDLKVVGEWNYSKPFTYNGAEQGVEFDWDLDIKEDPSESLTVEALKALLVLKYSGNSATTFGEYTATAQFDFKEEDENNNNFNLIQPENATQHWSIEKYQLSLDKTAWLLDGEKKDAVTWDGEEHSVEFDDSALLPEDTVFTLVKTYGGDEVTQTNAKESYSTYVTITVSLNGEDVGEDVSANFEILNNGEENAFTWTINKGTYDLSDGSWSEVKSFVFNGTEQGVEFVLPEGSTVPEEVYTVSGNKGKDAKQYTAEIKGNSSDNYDVIIPDDLSEYNWEITPFVLNISTMWETEKDSRLPYTYDGKQHQVNFVYALVGDTKLPEGVTLDELLAKESAEGSQETGTNAGTYTASARAVLNSKYEGKDNYSLELGAYNKFEWRIDPFEIVINGSWNYSTPFTYNGSMQMVEYTSWDSLTIPGVTKVTDLLRLTYLDDSYANSGENANKYTAKVTVEFAKDDAGNSNYTIVQPVNAELAWEIVKKSVNLIGSTWNYNAVTYTGSEYELSLIPSVTLENGMKFAFTYGGDYIKTDAGTYNNVYVSDIKVLKEDDTDVTANFEIARNFIGDSQANTYTWVIDPVQIFAERWSEGSLTYTGNEQSVNLILDSQAVLPENYELRYFGNKATVVGEYEAYVLIYNTLTDAVTQNYVLVGVYYGLSEDAPFVWSISKDTRTVDLSKFAWEWDGQEFTENGKVYTVKLKDVTLAEAGGAVLDTEMGNEGYDGNSAKDPGTYTAIAYFKVTQNDNITYVFAGNKNFITYTWRIVGKTPDVDVDGGKSTFDPVPLPGGGQLGIKIAGGTLPSETVPQVTASANEYTDDQFQPFVKSGTKAKMVAVYNIHIDIPADFNGVFVITLTNPDFADKDLVTVHIVGSASDTWEGISTNVNGNNITFNTTSFSDFVIVEQVPEEQNNAWFWVLLAVIIALLVVIIILLIVLILKKKGAPEEPTEDVKPVVIIKTEERVVEVEKEPEVLPEPAEELAVADEAVAEPVAPVIVPDITDEGRAIYDKSFSARLSQADEVVRQNYSDLKRDILAYKGVKSRMSWHFDSFNKGRDKCIKLQIRGKSMYMYIALNPAELPEKYHVKDVSDKARYADVPSMLKIRRPRSLKYAKQLVAMLMEKLGVERGELPNKFRIIPKQTTQALLQLNLIKIKVTKSSFLNKPNADAAKLDDNQAGDLQNSNGDKTEN